MEAEDRQQLKPTSFHLGVLTLALSAQAFLFLLESCACKKRRVLYRTINLLRFTIDSK